MVEDATTIHTPGGEPLGIDWGIDSSFNPVGNGQLSSENLDAGDSYSYGIMRLSRFRGC